MNDELNTISIPEEPDTPTSPGPTDPAPEADPKADPAAEASPEEDAPVEEEEDPRKEIAKKTRKAEKRYRRFQTFALRLLLLIVVVWVLFCYVVGFATVDSGDMYPRLDAGDLLLFYRLDTDVRYQDIIVFTKDGKRYVGRVIAAGGDTVEITDGESVVVNGNTLIESNIFYSTPRYEGFTEYPLTLGADECFVLADHRQGGEDSRFFGPVKTDEIAGTVISVLRRNNL